MNKIRSSREDPTLLSKAGVALAYVLLAWVVTTTPLHDMGNLLTIFMLLGFLVWVFVVRRRTAVNYFVRYHIVQAVLLNISLSAVLFLLIALLGLFATLPGVNMVVSLVYTLLFDNMHVANLFYTSAKDIIVMTLGLILAFTCFRNQYAELPFITDGVRHWV